MAESSSPRFNIFHPFQPAFKYSLLEGSEAPEFAKMIRSNLTGSALRGAIAATCGVTFLLFGYDQGVLGAVIGLPSFRRQFNHPNPDLEGIIACIYDIGAFLGAIVAFLTADRLGRRDSIRWGSWAMVGGTLLQASAQENIQLIMSRLITGGGVGVVTVAIPIWQAESFKSHNRGALLIIQSALVACGHPLSTFMGLASSQAEPSSFAWRWPIAFQGVFLVIILTALPFLPESPRWLVQHDRLEEAASVIARLEGRGIDSDHPSVLRQSEEMLSSVRQEKSLGQASWGEVFSEGKSRNLSRTLLGVGPYLMNQWSGINSLAYFLPITFVRTIGLSEKLSLVISGVLGLQYFLVSWLPYLFIENLGRRKVLMSSAAACSFCMFMIAVMLAIDTVAAQWIFVIFCFLFFDAFSLGILPISWMYSSEVLSGRTRNRGVATGVLAHWASNAVVVFITPRAIQNLGYRLYIIWACLNASFVPIVYFFYPETARRSLEDMDEIFLREPFGVTRTRSPGTRTARSDDDPDSS